MDLQPVPTLSAASSERPDEASTRLFGHWLVFVRVICILLVAYTLGFFATGLVIALAQHRTICTGLTCVLTIPEALIYFAVAALIFWHKSDEWMALEVALMLVLLAPLSALPNEILNLLGKHPDHARAPRCLALPRVCIIPALLLPLSQWPLRATLGVLGRRWLSALVRF